MIDFSPYNGRVRSSLVFVGPFLKQPIELNQRTKPLFYKYIQSMYISGSGKDQKKSNHRELMLIVYFVNCTQC